MKIDIRNEFRKWLNIQFMFHKDRTIEDRFEIAFKKLMKQIAHHVRGGDMHRNSFQKAREMYRELTP